MIKVSVIIPVYNVEPYLEECLDSVTGQTLKELEIICVDDGSTDGSGAILDSYSRKDGRIRVIRQENRGYGAAMNRGIGSAAGEYIGIVEPDDYIMSGMYQYLYRKAKGYRLDFVKADFYRFTQGGDGGREFVYNHLSTEAADYNRVFDPSADPEKLRFIMNTWSGIYRREFLEQYRILHNETPGAAFQDNGFWFQTFVYAHRAMILDRPFYCNRRDNPNSSINSREKVYCMNIEYDHIRDILMRDPDLWERFRPMYWFKKYHNYMGTLNRIGEEYKEEYVMRFAAELSWALKRGELVREPFTAASWRNIRRMTEDPRGYYENRVCPQSLGEGVFERVRVLDEENQRLTEEIAKIRAFWSFRVGRALMIGPGKVRAALAHRKQGGSKRN